MATKTFTITRTRRDNSIPFWKTHYINSQPDQAVAAQAITDFHTWIKAQPGIISFSENDSDESVIVQIQYNDALISDISSVLHSHSSGLAALAVTYYQEVADVNTVDTLE
jgi:anti-sigma-K factor RskA